MDTSTYGLIPSPEDKNDILTSEIAPQIVRYPETMLPPFDLTILNQGSYPACVGYSCATIKQYQEFRERITKTFDGLWIYDRCKEIDGVPSVAGTYFRVGMKVLQKQGAKPIDSSNPAPYKIGAYAQVTDMTFEGLKKMIFVYGTVLAGFIGSNSGWTSKSGIISNPKTGEKTWGHAVTVLGYCRISEEDDAQVRAGKMCMKEAINRWNNDISSNDM